MPPIALCNSMFTVSILSICLCALYQATTKASRRVLLQGITRTYSNWPSVADGVTGSSFSMLCTDLNAEEITGELSEDEEISDVNEYEECQYFTILGDHESFSEASVRD